MMRSIVVVCVLLFTGPVYAQVTGGELGDQAVTWLQEYIRINTVNPPGNEIAGARFLAAIFESEGIPYEIAESAPGRGNIWARLEGGDEPGLLLLHHIDVVPADPRYWITDPLSGEIRDGNIYGRGALDTKSLGIIQLAAFLDLHRSGVELSRDVVFMATADEEAGGLFGVGWLIEQRPELFLNIGYALNEGGGGSLTDGRTQFSIEITQKVPYWLRLTTRGEPGHGSRPQASTAVTELVAALDRLREHDFPFRVIPAVDAYFRGMAVTRSPTWQRRYVDIAAAIQQPGVADELRNENPSHYALLRNTCSMTRLSASEKINVIPTEAWAELDCRLLPDQSPEAFLQELGAILGEAVDVETLMGFTPASSSAETGLFRTIEDVTHDHYPEAHVVPSVLQAFTDSHFLRDLGITAYGFRPVAIPSEDSGGVHGNNERISVENVRLGVTAMSDIVRSWVID